MSISPEMAREAAASLRNKIKAEQEIQEVVETLNAEDEDRRAAVEEFIAMSKESERDWQLYKAVCEEAAVHFLDECSLHPTPEAVRQLTEAFLPSLAIICNRGYDEEGANWRAMGWRGLLMEVHTRWERIRFNSWKRGKHDPNNITDAINYLGYLLRMGNEVVDPEMQWGTIGEPGGMK